MKFNKGQIAASSAPIPLAILAGGDSGPSSVKCVGARGLRGGEGVE
jgi:hypothetical protein